MHEFPQSRGKGEACVKGVCSRAHLCVLEEAGPLIYFGVNTGCHIWQNPLDGPGGTKRHAVAVGNMTGHGLCPYSSPSS